MKKYMRPIKTSEPFQIGDLVCKCTEDEGVDPKQIGVITGCPPNYRMIRVKNMANQYRIWYKDYTHNVDYGIQDGNYRQK